MPASGDGVDIFIIFQYSNGIGHLARCSTIARQLSTNSRVTLLSGGRPVENFARPSGFDFVQLPAVRWGRVVNSDTVPIDSRYTAAEVHSIRSNLIVDAYRQKKPKVVIVEYFPFAPQRFGPTLDRLFEEIREERNKPVVICSTRVYPKLWDSDIDPAWVNERLRNDFHCVLHHADSNLFPLDSFDTYFQSALSGVRVVQTGFVRRPIAPSARAGPSSGLLLTVGGGDSIGAKLLVRWIESARAGSRDLFPLNVVCGPMMGPEDRKMVRAYEDTDIVVHDWSEDMDHLISASCGVVCLGGYNTLVESLSFGKPVLSFPHKGFGDQAFQVSRLFSQGMLLMGSQTQGNTETTVLMDELLRFRPRYAIDCNGAERTVEVIGDLLDAV